MATRMEMPPPRQAGPWLRDAWYVVAWSHEVGRENLFPRTVLGQPLLLYRRGDGTPVVLADRCAHRHAPLSMGEREGDAVRCGYHGVLFGDDGRCREVPGQEQVPVRLCVRGYPVVERHAWWWVWMGDPARADAARIPDCFSLDHPEWRCQPGYLHYPVPHALIADNLLDFSHLSYVHRRTLGGTRAIADTRPEVTRLDDGVHIRRDVMGAPASPMQQRLHGIHGLVDRRFDYRFVVPGVLLLDSRFAPAGTPLDDLSRVERLHSCQALTPETEDSTHYFFAQAHRSDVGDEDMTAVIHAALVEAFLEDKAMIVAQHARIRAAPDEPMRPIAADLALAQYRRLLAALITAETAHPTTHQETP